MTYSAKSPISLVLPYPPTVNHYWKVTRQGRVYLTARGKDYREAVANIVQPAGKCGELGALPITEPVRVWAKVWMPDRRRRDIDNLSKGLLDSLGYAGIYVDDCLVHDFRITRMGVDKEAARVEVSIEIEQEGD